MTRRPVGILSGAILALIGLAWLIGPLPSLAQDNTPPISLSIDGGFHKHQSLTTDQLLMEESGYDPEGGGVYGFSSIARTVEDTYRKIIVTLVLPGRRTGQFELGDYRASLLIDQPRVDRAVLRIKIKPYLPKYPRPDLAEEYNSLSGTVDAGPVGDRLFVRFTGRFADAQAKPEYAIKGLLVFKLTDQRAD